MATKPAEELLCELVKDLKITLDHAAEGVGLSCEDVLKDIETALRKVGPPYYAEEGVTF